MGRDHKLLDGVIFGVAGYLMARAIRRNWWRASVRASVTGVLVFVAAWVAGFVGAAIVAAYVKPWDQAGLGPILGWTALVAAAVAVAAAWRAITFWRAS